MSTATAVPETWELTGDDARETLLHTGRRKLVRDAFQRLRASDGFSHARSLAFALALVLVQAIIALVGLAAALGEGGASDVIVRSLEAAAPGPAGDLLTSAVTQAHQAGTADRHLGLTLGLLGAIITGTTLMGQLERALNRLYGIEADRPSVEKYTRAFVLTITSGVLVILAFACLALGSAIGEGLEDNPIADIWAVVRWPLALALMMGAMALLFRWSPRRHQPQWSWLAFGASVSVLLWCAVTLALGWFFRVSTSFGETYGPLAGIVALLLWAFLSSVAVLFGAAVAAQLEAVRAGRPKPKDERKDVEPAQARRPRLLGEHNNVSDRIDDLRRIIEGVIGVPATEGNRIDVLHNGDEIFPVMLDSIGSAEHAIDFLTFVYWTGEIGRQFVNRLSERARSGVRVRVLLDVWGAHPMEKALIEEMDEAGVHIRWFRPMARLRLGTLNHRTHRKVMIVDESAGFTGGVGIADEWQGDARGPDEWRDTHFRITGPAVDGLRAAFLDNWAETDPVLFDEKVDRFPAQPQPGDTIVQCVRGVSETGLSDIETLFRALLQSAGDCVRATTAYFVPDDELTGRLCDAADRGVHVQLLLPGPHADKRFVQLAGEAMYPTLLDHGVELWNFQPSMMHAKVMTVDGVLANIGSANLNARSTSCDEEINIVALDPELVRILDEQFDEDLERSVRIEPGRWQRRSLAQRTAESIVAPIRRWS